ncbi:hypothetical protein IWX46DRAFT_210340 [Phyllosticta citricarpa]|uniref:Uncharacterized protein n=1 Tax=Phyllosticta citricarpa TaxID=55181 RepID=A0ABR1LWD7_9PEZI
MLLLVRLLSVTADDEATLERPRRSEASETTRTKTSIETDDYGFIGSASPKGKAGPVPTSRLFAALDALVDWTREYFADARPNRSLQDRVRYGVGLTRACPWNPCPEALCRAKLGSAYRHRQAALRQLLRYLKVNNLGAGAQEKNFKQQIYPRPRCGMRIRCSPRIIYLDRRHASNCTCRHFLLRSTNTVSREHEDVNHGPNESVFHGVWP